MATRKKADPIIVDGEEVDPETGEVQSDRSLAAVPAEAVAVPALVQAPHMLAVRGTPITKEQDAILRAPTPVDWVLTREDGMHYVEQVEFRQRLNDAFGVGGWLWHMIGQPQIYSKERNGKRTTDVCLYGALYAFQDGAARLLAESWGESRYFEHENPATAMEKAKSDSITRACKDLGMFADLWRKGWYEHAMRQQQSGSQPEAKREAPSAPAPARPAPAMTRGDRDRAARDEAAKATPVPPAPVPATKKILDREFTPTEVARAELDYALQCECTTAEEKASAIEYVARNAAKGAELDALHKITQHIKALLTKKGCLHDLPF